MLEVAAAPAAAPAKRRRPPRNTFMIRFVIEGAWYSVVPLKPDPAVARKAFRMRKLGPKGERTAEYDVAISAEGFPSCECKGFLRWHKPCRHLRTLAAAGMIQLPAARQPVTTAATPEAQAGKEDAHGKEAA
jgi:hypothetical protein